MKEKYYKKVVPEIMKKHNYSSPLAVPRITKVVVNSGIGRVRDDKEREAIERGISLITGQKVSGRKARKSIASFKTRTGMIIGLVTTLRGARMYDFLSRLINIAFPRTRDFRGLGESSLDSNGNLNVGIREHIVFPEVIGEDVKNIFGVSITVSTNAKSREAALEMLKLMGFPFKS